MHRALQINRDALNLARSGRLAGQKASNKEARHCGISVGFQSFSFERGLRCSPQTSKKVFKTGWFVKCVALPTRHTSQSQHRLIIIGTQAKFVANRLQQRPPRCARLARSPDYCRNIHTNAVERGVSVWTTSAGLNLSTASSCQNKKMSPGPGKEPLLSLDCGGVRPRCVAQCVYQVCGRFRRVRECGGDACQCRHDDALM